MSTFAVIALTAVVTAGCSAHTGPDRQRVADALAARTGATARPALASTPGVPAGVVIEDGLSRDEAVAIALWNNAEFQVILSELGFARADLLEAGLLRNPILSLLFPAGPKQLETTLRLPVEVLWERPRRVAAARVAADAAADRLVQAGLDLTASVKIAHADVVLAGQRRVLSEETARLLRRISDLTESRLAAGDISELEARAARVDAARGAEDATRASRDLGIATERLRGWLGFAAEGPPFEIAAPEAEEAECGTVSALLRAAIASRPDVRAAELGVEAAGARLGWERSRTLALAAVLDANGEGREGFELGPGLEVALPIFDRNDAGRARAGAELERASAAYVAAQQRVAFELREAALQLEQARLSRAAWRDTIVAPLERNVAEAEASFAQGEVSYLFVLDQTRRLTEAKVREREVDADLRRAHTRIEHAIGRRCGITQP